MCVAPTLKQPEGFCEKLQWQFYASKQRKRKKQKKSKRWLYLTYTWERKKQKKTRKTCVTLMRAKRRKRLEIFWCENNPSIPTHPCPVVFLKYIKYTQNGRIYIHKAYKILKERTVLPAWSVTAPASRSEHPARPRLLSVVSLSLPRLVPAREPTHPPVKKKEQERTIFCYKRGTERD